MSYMLIKIDIFTNYMLFLANIYFVCTAKVVMTWTHKEVIYIYM